MKRAQSRWENSNDGYFDSLPSELKELVADLLKDAIDEAPENYGDHDVESIECHARDGFSPFAYNRGGYQVNAFSSLSVLHGSGVSVAHVKAQAEIDSMIEYSLKCARESFFENNEAELKALGIENAESVSYHDLYEMGQGALAESFSEYETENLSDDGSSIMFQVRFMYHGVDAKGNHSASVSTCVNTEAPYHRSSYDRAEETEISWKTKNGLERKLKATLKIQSRIVF